MRQSIRILVLSMLITLCFNVHAQDENYDALYLSVTREYTLNTDGTIDFLYAQKLKLQNHRSFHRLYGETFIVYHPDYQKLKINQAYTIMADGKKVNTPNNAFNEVLPRFAARAPAFNRLREMVITHTGLEIGSTINLDYRIQTTKGFFPAFMGSTVLAKEQPVKSMVIVLRTPADQPVYFYLFNSKIKPTETMENGFRVYTWVMNDIPAMAAERLQQDHPAIYPSLIFSSLNRYQPLVDFFLNQEPLRYQITTEMSEFVKGLETEYQKKSDLLFAIQESVVKDINLFDIPGEYTGYRLRSPAQLWNSNGGTMAEKAVLMTALLKKAGIKAEPVLVFQGNQFDGHIGNLTCLKEWIVRAEVSGLGVVYLSVKQVNAFDMMVLEPGTVFMVLKEDHTFQLVYPENKKSTASMKGVFVVDPELNLSGELTGTLSGGSYPFLALIRSEDKLKHYIRGGGTSAKIKTITLSEMTPCATEFSAILDKTNALKRDSNFFYFTVPFFNTGVDNWDIGELVAERLTPVELPFTIKESYNITLAIPETLKLASGEQEIRINNRVGSFLYLVKEKENMLRIQKEIEIDKKVIGTADYRAFKELMDNWNLFQTNNVILRK
ncbi:MAG: DUF3857 domain-containing protein [Bacteroidota bacterium]